MARKKADRPADQIPTPPPPAPTDEETTGRYIIVLSEEAAGNPKAAAEVVKKALGVADVAASDDYDDAAVDVAEAAAAGAVVFSNLGIAVVNGDPDRLEAVLTAAGDGRSGIESIEPEKVYYAIETGGAEYLRGYKDAVEHLYSQLNGKPTAEEMEEALARFADTNQLTWGLQATRVPSSRYTGQGIKVAVLDTGFDLRHPDFRGRRIVHQSFVANETTQDGHGHGTHCTGTACGPRAPVGHRRYGAAFGAEIHIGKVLSNGGSGGQMGIIAGMEWAITRGCHVISMSLGNSVTDVSPAYERAGKVALERGCLIVAAAGNNRPQVTVAQPANSPSILAVGAVDSDLRLASFSARSTPVPGGKVDLVGPGVQVDSSWIMPTRYRIISGTSMATPHVAGIAALWAQASGARGAALWNLLTRSARPVAIPSIDGGAGLVQAPQ